MFLSGMGLAALPPTASLFSDLKSIVIPTQEESKSRINLQAFRKPFEEARNLNLG
jgi:hypothetical protein